MILTGNLVCCRLCLFWFIKHSLYLRTLAHHNQICNYLLTAALTIIYNTKKPWSHRRHHSIKVVDSGCQYCQAKALRESGEGGVMKIKTGVGVKMDHLPEPTIYTRKFSAVLVAAFREYLLSTCSLLGAGSTQQYKLLPLPHLSYGTTFYKFCLLAYLRSHSFIFSSPSRLLLP